MPRTTANNLPNLEGPRQDDRRRARYRRRSTLHRLASAEVQKAHGGEWRNPAGGQNLRWHRAAGCGRSVVSIDGLVGVRTMTTDNGTGAYFDGVMVCGSVWLCTVCTAKIRARRSMEVEAAAAVHVARGGRIAMVTLTVRHSADMPLQALLDALQGSWTSVQQSAFWRRFRRHLRGTIAAKEVTIGANGWHPHLHVLLLLDGDGGDQLEFEEDLVGFRLDTLRLWLVDAWAERVERRLGARPSHHGVDVRALSADAAGYVTKISQEQVRADHKTNDVLPVLLDQVEAGDLQAVARFHEYAAAMHGRRMLVWSRGLRDDLLGDDAEELTDEEIAALEVGGRLVGTLTRAQYRRLTKTSQAQPVPATVALLEAVERGDYSGLAPPRPPAGPGVQPLRILAGRGDPEARSLLVQLARVR